MQDCQFITQEYLWCRPEDRQLHIQFLRSPTAFLPDESGHVKAVDLEENMLQPVQAGSGASTQKAVGTGRHEQLSAQLMLESIGYRSDPIPGAPFDARTGTVPNL